MRAVWGHSLQTEARQRLFCVCCRDLHAVLRKLRPCFNERTSAHTAPQGAPRWQRETGRVWSGGGSLTGGQLACAGLLWGGCSWLSLGSRTAAPRALWSAGRPPLHAQAVPYQTCFLGTPLTHPLWSCSCGRWSQLTYSRARHTAGLIPKVPLFEDAVLWDQGPP